MKQISDSEILDLIRNDKTREKGFSWLVKKYQEKLYMHIRRMVSFHEDAHDVFQNTMIKVIRYIESFKGDSSLFTWLYRIATNESIRHLQKKKKVAATVLDENAYALKLISDPYFSGEEALSKLHAAIAYLPERQKAVFNMKYFDDLKYKEIADILEVSEGSLKASYHHAVKKIEARLKIQM